MNRPTHGGNLAWAGALAGCSPSFILDFSASINPLGPPKSAIAAIEAALKNLVAYPYPGYDQLRLALNQLHPHLTPEWILPGNGSAELLTWAGRELAQLDETSLVTPAFSDYQRALKAFDAKVSKFPLLDSDGVWAEQLPEALISYGNTAVRPGGRGLLLNNPHNPSGMLFELEAILPLLEQFALVVVDEAFMDFLPPEQQQSLISVVQDYENLVILRSLTKFYSLPGLRLGYCIAHPKRLRRWQQWRDPWSVNSLAEAAAIAVVQDTEFQQMTWNWLKAARRQLEQGLASLPGLQPRTSAANFLLVHSEQSVTKLQEKLLKHSQILIRDCLSFPELGDRFFRVAVRTEAENQRLLKGLAEII
ncbi:MAG: threonine-phosphate decarboxylase CobD [Coleofasciculaceae cyanobacterium]